MFTLAQIFGILGIIANILSMQFKNRKHIFIALTLVNLFSALNFFCLGRFSSGLIDLLGNLEMGVNKQFEKRNRSVPKMVVIIYIIATVALGIVTSSQWLDYLVVIAAVGFCFTILMKDEQKIRALWLAVMTLYLVYDLIVGAYTFAASGLFSLISTIIAIVRYRKKNP